MEQIKKEATYFIRIQTNSRNKENIKVCSCGGKVRGSGDTGRRGKVNRT